MSEPKKAHIFAHNHRPAEDPQGEVLLVQEFDVDKVQITARSKAQEHHLTHSNKKVTLVGPTAHIILTREQALDLSDQLREWASTEA